MANSTLRVFRTAAAEQPHDVDLMRDARVSATKDRVRCNWAHSAA
jgi:hypothetical protein